MIDLNNLIAMLHIQGIEKTFFLIFVGLIIIITIIVTVQVKSLNRSVYIRPAHGSAIIQILTFLYLFFVISLFLTALVIL